MYIILSSLDCFIQYVFDNNLFIGMCVSYLFLGKLIDCSSFNQSSKKFFFVSHMKLFIFNNVSSSPTEFIIDNQYMISKFVNAGYPRFEFKFHCNVKLK